MKKVFIVVGGLLVISISLNAVLWLKTLEEMHASISSVKRELEEVGCWVQSFQERHGRLPSIWEQAGYGMKGVNDEGLDMTLLEGKDGISIGFEMKDHYKGVYDVSLHRIMFDKETLEKWRRKGDE